MDTETLYFTLRVEYDRTLEAYLKMGAYDYVDPYVTPANFPPKAHGARDVRMALVPLRAVMTTAEALDYHRALGLRPATIYELLALGAEHPELQQSFPIVAFGSSCLDGPEASSSVPTLRSIRNGSRDVYLDWTEYRWSHEYRILGVRD